MPITLYFSGFESSWPDLVKLKESKLEHTPKAIMMSYMHMQTNSRAWANLKEFRAKYKGMVMIDSGAFSFLHNDLTDEAKASAASREVRTSEGAKALSGKEDAYIHRYMDWLEQNRDAYDWAVELDIQKIVGQEQVDKWREEFLARKIPIVIVLHRNAGDTIATARKWKEKGCEYFGIGSGWSKEDAGDRLLLQELSEVGKVHIFGWTPADMFNYKKYVTSVDSTSWLQAGKGATLFVTKGKKLELLGDIRHQPMQLQRVMIGPVMQLWSKEERDRAVKEHKYRILNFQNLVELQRWVDVNNEEQGYVDALATINDGKAPMPEWAGETDRMGRSKAIYLKSRFNAMKSGMYARVLQQNAMECNTCIVNDRCPAFEKDNLCAFINIWRKGGARTRNKEQILRMMEDTVSQKWERYERARYMEAKLGGATDTAVSMFENDLMKAIEILHRVKYGTPGTGMKVALQTGPEGVKLGVQLNSEQMLEELRTEYGSRLADKINKKRDIIDAEGGEVVDNRGEQPQEDTIKPDAV